MIARRFVYDPRTGGVVELGLVSVATPPRVAYEHALGNYKQRPDEATGAGLRNAALERADRRVHAYRRSGDESRWSE